MRNAAAFGFGVGISAIAAFVLAMRGDDKPLNYAVYCLIWFCIGYGLMLVATHSIDLHLLYLEYLDRAATLRLSTAQKNHQLDTIGAAPVIASSVQPKVIYDRTAKWREWYISVFEWAGESIHYRGHLDAVMTYDLWRKVFCKALADHTPPLIEPITNGDRTELRGGLTVASVLFMLKSGALQLPYPDEHDPPPPIARNANVETRQKREEMA